MQLWRQVLLGVLAALLPRLAICLELKLPTAQALNQVHAEAELLQSFHTSGTMPLLGGLGKSADQLNVCDITSSGPVCLSDRKRALVPDAVPAGLVGKWSFDEAAALDSSGYGNHGAMQLTHGPSPAGSGHSARFERTFLMIPNSPQFSLSEFTYSMWVFLLEDASSQPLKEQPKWCPLIRKGIHEVQTNQFSSAPSLVFSPKTGQLRAAVTTSISGIDDGEVVETNARLASNRWMHVAVVYHSAKKSLLVYVNGILDVAMATKGIVMTNDYPLYVGGDPFTADQCDRAMYMDDLRVHSRAVLPHEIQAVAAPALGGVDPSYVRLGCLRCTAQKAVAACPKSRHVCTALELHTGGYQVARSLGWLASGAHVWTHAAVEQQRALPLVGAPGQAPQEGVGLCCEGE